MFMLLLLVMIIPRSQEPVLASRNILKVMLPEDSLVPLHLAATESLPKADGWLFDREIGLNPCTFDCIARLFRGGLSGVMDFDLGFGKLSLDVFSLESLLSCSRSELYPLTALESDSSLFSEFFVEI